MANADSISRTSDTECVINLSPTSTHGQAATRAAYIARVISEAPPIPDDVLDRLAVLLRPAPLRVAA